jgi:hypothetical protein
MTGTEVRLASMIVHLVEAQSADGHAFDRIAARNLLQCPDVREILTPSGLIPATRSGKSVLELLEETQG